MTHCFVVKSVRNRTGRLDVHFFDPRYHETIGLLEEATKKHPGWEVQILGELLRLGSRTRLTGGATPTGAGYITEGVKFLRVQNIGSGRFLLDDVVYIDENTHNGLLARSQLKPGDVILTITGTYGNASVVPEDFGEANINQHCVKIEVKDDMIEPMYLSAFLNSRLGKVQMDRMATGSSRPALDYSAIESLQILLPTQGERQRLTWEIEGYERKALSLRLRAGMLLEQTHGLLLERLGISMPERSAGRSFLANPSSLDDRLDATSQDPFLGALIDSLNAGKYSVKKLRDIADVDAHTKDPRSSPDSPFQLLELEDIDGGIGEVTNYKEKYGAQFEGTKRVLKPGALAVSRLRFYLRKVALVPGDLHSNILGSTELLSVSPQAGTDSMFLREILRHRLLIQQAECYVTGSTRPRINMSDLEDLFLPAPPSEDQEKIGRELKHIHEEVVSLRLQALSIESDIATVVEGELLRAMKMSERKRNSQFRPLNDFS